jgi:hypothetical protein
MPQLPPVVWVIAAGVALLLLALCVATVYAMLRPAMRLRVARWPLPSILLLAGAAAIPWLIVSFAPIAIRVSINGTLQLIGWLFLIVIALALLVLLPLAALVSAFVWASAKARARAYRPGAP